MISDVIVRVWGCWEFGEYNLSLDLKLLIINLFESWVYLFVKWNVYLYSFIFFLEIWDMLCIYDKYYISLRG